MIKKVFKKYLKSIGITNTLKKRIEEIYNFYQKVCPEEITTIFVTDYIKEDGTREYENLWFFSKKYAMEAKRFIGEDDFDMAPIQNQIHYWTIKKNDYDFKKAEEKSRLHLDISFGYDISGEFKASKENCDYLKKIFLKYVIPNVDS